jgi:small subunit ribosomal protein S17
MTELMEQPGQHAADGAATGAPAAKGSLIQTQIGRVVSDKMDKTVTVVVERQVMHPTIGKVVKRTKKYHAHNEGNDAKMGDRVVIEECRPISKTKAWKVARVQERARPE